MRKNENGRSMVEMLGVLAIIGVLSVGGIYGYTVAMRRHKANEIMQTANMLAIMASSMQGTEECLTLSDSGLPFPVGDSSIEMKVETVGETIVYIKADNDVCNIVTQMDSAVIDTCSSTVNVSCED